MLSRETKEYYIVAEKYIMLHTEDFVSAAEKHLPKATETWFGTSLRKWLALSAVGAILYFLVRGFGKFKKYNIL